MQNEHGHRMIIQPSDMRLLIYLARRCLAARRAWRRAQKTLDLPMEIVTLHEGHWREAWNSFQGAKALVEVRRVPPNPKLSVDDFLYCQRNTVTGAHRRSPHYGVLVSLTPRELMQRLIVQPASDAVRERLVSIGNDVRHVAVLEQRDLTDDERSLLSEIQQYVRQIEGLVPHLTRHPQPDSWFSSELIAVALNMEMVTERVTPIRFRELDHPDD